MAENKTNEVKEVNEVKAVKEGKGVNVSDQRRAELEAQFADDAPPPPPSPESPEEQASHFKDVAMWPDLAMEWMKRF